MSRSFNWQVCIRLIALAAVLSPIAAFTISAADAQQSAVPRVAAKPVCDAMQCRECGCPITAGSVCTDCRQKLVSKGMMKSADMRTGNFVYTLDNDVARNSVAVYHRGADGSLMMLAGSPFNAGGKGLSGGDIDEQGAIRVTGQYVLAVNPGSNTIAVMRKSSTGLLHVEGSPFPSGGSTPLSLAVHGDLVYVANQAAEFAHPTSEPNITGFRLMTNGQLMPLPNSTVKLPKGQGPAQVEFAPDGRVLVATAGFQADDANASRLYSFMVMPNGQLAMGPGSPIKPDGAVGTVGFSIGADGRKVFASVFKGSAVIPFDLDPSTAAIRQAGSPVGDDQRAACWTAISRDGRTLYVANFVSNSVSVYDVAAEGKLTLLGSVPRRGATDKDTKDLELSPDGHFLYVVGSGARQISVFRVESNRLLTELPSGQSPITLSTGQNITGLATD